MVSSLAEPRFVSALLAARVLAAWRRDGWRAACAPSLVIPAGAMARRHLSQVIRRPRPPESGWLTEPEGFTGLLSLSFLPTRRASRHRLQHILPQDAHRPGWPGPRRGVPSGPAPVTRHAILRKIE